VEHKLLVIQTAFTGDVVLATAIIEKLHAYFPGAQLDFLLRKGNEGLLQNHPYITNLLIWDKKTQKNRNLLRMALRVRREKYTHVINIHRFAHYAVSQYIICRCAQHVYGIVVWQYIDQLHPFLRRKLLGIPY